MKLSVKQVVLFGLCLLVVGGWLGKWFFQQPDGSHHERHDEELETLTWTCSMHPQIRQSEVGSCPICGMELITLSASPPSSAPANAVAMSPAAMQLAQVVTHKVGPSAGVNTLQLYGKIQPDERRIFSQTSHIPGRVERLAVTYTGAYVKKGAVLAYLYSPELVTAQKELLLAVKYKEAQPQLFSAAYDRLAKWKLTDQQIRSVLAAGEAQEEFPILADQSGYVLEKSVNLGDHVDRGQVLFTVVDLSHVWALLEVYEQDLQWVQQGDFVSFQVAALPGSTFEGTIEYVDPTINPQTRAAQVRLVVPNPAGKLKPEMLLQGQLETRINDWANRIAVPKSAVMWTGLRSLVYVLLETSQSTYFEAREIVLGPRLGDTYVVLDGLAIGEEVAVNGTFSIDAAAQLSGKRSMMSITDLSSFEPLPVDKTYQVGEAAQGQFRLMFEAYLLLKDALVDSDPQATAQRTQVLSSALQDMEMNGLSADIQAIWLEDLRRLRQWLEAIGSTTALDEQRAYFSPFSDQLYYTFKRFRVQISGFRQFCPMAEDNQGAFWLSDSESIRNPYFGEAMLSCGSVEENLGE